VSDRLSRASRVPLPRPQGSTPGRRRRRSL